MLWTALSILASLILGVALGVRLERKDQELWQQRDYTADHWRRRA